MADSRYSYSLTTFSPSGKLLQIEYALKAVEGGATALGIKAKDGVVIATEKKLSTNLIDENTVKKIQLVSPNIGIVYSGMNPDFRVLLARGRKSAQQYYRRFGKDIPIIQMVTQLAGIMQQFTQSGGVRPFGVSLLVGGFDAPEPGSEKEHDKSPPQLFQIDPAGTYFAWKASAIGKNDLEAKTFLERRYNEDIGLEDAIHTALLTLKESFEGELSGSNVEVGVVDDTTKLFKVLTPNEVNDYLKEVE